MAAQKFAEQFQVCQGFLPVDMAGGANTGDWVSLKNYGKVVILVYKAIGTAGDDPTITVQQATAVAGTSAKALNFTTVWKKQAATNLLATGTWTKVTQTAANTFTHTDLAEQAAIIAIEFSAEDLDADNGFDCVQASIADVGTNAQLGACLYLLSDPRFPQETLDSAIVD